MNIHWWGMCVPEIRSDCEKTISVESMNMYISI